MYYFVATEVFLLLFFLSQEFLVIMLCGVNAECSMKKSHEALKGCISHSHQSIQHVLPYLLQNEINWRSVCCYVVITQAFFILYILSQ